jgi:hypothetical protein
LKLESSHWPLCFARLRVEWRRSAAENVIRRNATFANQLPSNPCLSFAPSQPWQLYVKETIADYETCVWLVRPAAGVSGRRGWAGNSIDAGLAFALAAATDHNFNGALFEIQQSTMGVEPTADAIRCPACGNALGPAAVLCVGCGYHLKLGYHLSTAVESPRHAPALLIPSELIPNELIPSDNPYAAPISSEGQRESGPREHPEFDLTESGAKWAQGVVSDAKSLVWLIFVSFWCGLLGVLMFPWFAFRIACWHRLNARFSELRNPNAFSTHGVLAADFQEAVPRLWIGAAFGLVYWALIAAYILARVAAGSSENS